jgi:MFS family permease
VNDFSFKKIAVAAFGPSLLFGIGEGAILPVVALLARELGASVPMAALAVMLISIGCVLNNVPASVLITKLGERTCIVAAGVWSALGMAVCLFATHFAMLAVGCFMIGMSQGVYNLARQSYMTEVVPVSHRARALSSLGGVVRIGTFIGPFAGAAVIHFYGLSAAFAVGIIAALSAASLAAGIRDLKAPGAPLPAQAPARVSVLTTFADHRRVFLTLGIAIALVGAVRAARQVVLPLWADHLGLSPAVSSLIYGLAGGIEMLVFYPAGKVMDVKGRRWVALPSMLIMGAGMLAMPFTASFATMLLAAMAIGFGNGIGSGMNMTLGADHAPAQGRAYFLGVWRLLADIGATAGPAALSLIVSVGSLAAGISAIGLVAVTAAALLHAWIPSSPERGAR